MSRSSIVIVSFNTRAHLEECLTTVCGQDVSCIVVADNGSTDGSVSMVRRTFPSVVVDVDESNPGYGAGANRGIRRCGTDDVLLLNSDTRLAAGAAAALTVYLDAHPKVGVAGPRLVNQDGTLQRSAFRFPSPLRPPLQSDPLAPLIAHIPGLRERYLATWSHSEARPVPYVMGAALAIRRRAFDEVGGFDESFFMYAEEVDLCWRMRAAGWDTHFAPVTTVTHVGRASTRQYRAHMLERSALSSLTFYRRHYSGLRLAQAQLTMRAGMSLRLLRDAARYLMAADAARRRELRDNLGVWRRVLASEPSDGAR